MPDPLEVYSIRVTRLSKSGAAVTKREWRWRLRSSNGRIVADSGEGYLRRADALDGFRAVVVLVRVAAALGLPSRKLRVSKTKPVRKRK